MILSIWLLFEYRHYKYKCKDIKWTNQDTKFFFLKVHPFIVYYITIGLRIPVKLILKDLIHALHQLFSEATH